MAEELMVVLKRSDTSGLGFSLLGTASLPPIIYDIIENSPAAESGEVEAGDIVLKVNETQVERLTTRDVLRTLRLTKDPVTLKLRRDPAVKARVREHLCSPTSSRPLDEDLARILEANSNGQPTSTTAPSATSTAAATATTTTTTITTSSNSSSSTSSTLITTTTSISTSTTTTTDIASVIKTKTAPLADPEDAASSPLPAVDPVSYTGNNNNNNHQDTVDRFEESPRFQWEPLSERITKQPRRPRFEAFMMTGDLILNLSPTQQKQPTQQHSQSHHHHHHYHHHHSQTSSNRQTQAMLLRSLQYHAPQTQCTSVPSSPSEMDLAATTTGNSSGNYLPGDTTSSLSETAAPPRYTAPGFVRTSRSEDHLQQQKDSSLSAVDIDFEDDMRSSLNTLLDTRADQPASSTADRIVWSFNNPSGPQQPVSSGSSTSSSSEEDASPARSISPNSPTSVSSSVMSSESSSRGGTLPGAATALASATTTTTTATTTTSSATPSAQHGGCLEAEPASRSEAVSNISSPDYQEEETLDILSSRDLMEISDPSDSDSTLLVSDRAPPTTTTTPLQSNNNNNGIMDPHRIVIQVAGPCQNGHDSGLHQQAFDSSPSSGDPLTTTYLTSTSTVVENNIQPQNGGSDNGLRSPSSSSSPGSEDESDDESLDFRISPKAVDVPSAIRLAKRLYALDGFKKSDVSRQLSKNNEFSRVVAEEYLKYFNFEKDSLDKALRKFLKQFSLTGETQERERVLVHFSKRYLECNPGTFNSQDAVHTLTCAIMLLNTDLHGQNIGRKMSCAEFIENLSELNDGDNFPRDVLKHLYAAIKNCPLEWALDDEGDECGGLISSGKQLRDGLEGSSGLLGSSNPFLDVPNAANATEFKKGYTLKKSCIEPNGKKTSFGRRSWKMCFVTLKGLVLYVHKDEHGFRKGALTDHLHNAIRIHHALATRANDYVKKQHVFRLQTADQAEYLFQTSDSKELQSWIDTINFVCASFSAQPLAGGVGSQNKFQRPLLPCSHTKLNLREQLRDHEERVQRLEMELEEHRRSPPERGAKSLVVQNYREKDAYLAHELNRYRTYSYILRERLSQYAELEPSLAEADFAEEEAAAASVLSSTTTSLSSTTSSTSGQSIVATPLAEGCSSLVPPPVPERRPSPTNRLNCLRS